MAVGSTLASTAGLKRTLTIITAFSPFPTSETTCSSLADDPSRNWIAGREIGFSFSYFINLCSGLNEKTKFPTGILFSVDVASRTLALTLGPMLNDLGGGFDSRFYGRLEIDHDVVQGNGPTADLLDHAINYGGGFENTSSLLSSRKITEDVAAEIKTAQ